MRQSPTQVVGGTVATLDDLPETDGVSPKIVDEIAETPGPFAKTVDGIAKFPGPVSKNVDVPFGSVPNGAV